MRRILFCTDSLESGGVERQLTELVTHLDRARFAPRVLALYGARVGRPPHFAPRLQTANVPLELLDLSWQPRDKLRGLLAIMRAVWRFRPDVLHAMNYHSNLLSRAARPLLPPTMKLIGSIRGNYSAKQLRYERFSWRLCTRIVINSPALQPPLITQAHVPAARIVYIPNGVDTVRFASRPDFNESNFRQQIAPDARRVLVCMGRISAEKQMHWVVQALGVLKRAKRLPDNTRLFIVGAESDAAAVASLDAAITADGLAVIVTRCPDTDQPERYYHAADATILFSPAEGMPNVVLESLAAGHPVLVSEGANQAGLIAHGLTGWVVPTGNIAALAEQLHAILSLSDDDLSAFRDACTRRAAEFSLPAMLERYSALYETWHYRI